MDRKDFILEFARKDQRGIEIGPYFNPIVAKSAGWNVLSLDVFDTEELRRRAAADPNIPSAMVANIEEVDLVGPAHRIAELVAARGETGSFDFILSSHNFEHLPDPVSFLQACSEVLRPGGVLSMAIPDKRCCFDYYRPLTGLPAVLQAWAEKRARPTAEQVFEHLNLHCRLQKGSEELIAFPLSDDPADIVACRTVEDAHGHWRSRLAEGANNGPYMDAHCWTFVPSSFRLLFLDLRFLGYLPFEPLRFHDTWGGEFYVHLRNMRGSPTAPLSRNDYYEERQRLLQAVSKESCRNAIPLREVQLSADAEKNAARLEKSLAEAEERSRAQETALTTLRSHLAELEAERKSLRHERDIVLDSTFWRLTKPARRLAAAMPRGLKHRMRRALRTGDHVQ
ncbi:MAG TPA: methyltransferase domain-containing protein [Acidobacteriaceae bacterium]|nr:methyltransferase domain-containing protein [Acidobacteriaceae bacterium]